MLSLKTTRIVLEVLYSYHPELLGWRSVPNLQHLYYFMSSCLPRISSTDPSAELQVAQARINDLEAHILTQKTEVS